MTKSDSQLFFELVGLTTKTLKIYSEIEAGEFGEDDRLSEIQSIIDVPMVEGILMNALDEIDASLKLGIILAQKHGLEELRQRLTKIQGEP